MNAEQEARLEAIERKLDRLLAREEARAELYDEVVPIAKSALATATTHLAALERRGYFAFGRELVKVADRVVTGFTPADVEALGDNVVGILETVRKVTGPRVMEVAAEAAGAIEDGGGEGAGVFDVLRATKDDDVKRGLAAALAVLRHVGRASRVATGARTDAREKLRARLAPRVERAAPSPPDGMRSAPPAAKAPASKVALSLPGVELDDDGFFVDSTQWSESIAEEAARQLGLAELVEEHWTVLRYAREDAAARGQSPNVRRLAMGSGVSTRDIYRLFRTAPGVTVARIAGIKKPVGCI